MKQKDAKKLRQKKRKKREHKKSNRDTNLFLKLTGVDSETNAYYALEKNDKFTSIIEKVDKAITKSQKKETRDRALNHLVRSIISNLYKSYGDNYDK